MLRKTMICDPGNSERFEFYLNWPGIILLLERKRFVLCSETSDEVHTKRFDNKQLYKNGNEN